MKNQSGADMPSLFDKTKNVGVNFTQKQLSLIDLLESGKHSALDVSSILPIGDARSEIRNIRNRGVDVRDEWVRSRDSKYKLYWIEKG